jgi:hypothetical protein
MTDYDDPHLAAMEAQGVAALDRDRQGVIANRAVYEDLVFPPTEAMVALQESGLEVVFMRRLDVTIRAPFDFIHSLERNREHPILRVVLRNESEFMLKFASEDVVDELVAEYQGSQWRHQDDEGIQRFAERLTVPVGEWMDCPMCGSELSQRVEHAARCSSCGGLYADDFWTPTVEHDDTKYGRLVGVSARPPLISEIVLSGSVRPWITGGRSSALPAVPYYDLEQRVRSRAGAEQQPPLGDISEDDV